MKTQIQREHLEKMLKIAMDALDKIENIKENNLVKYCSKCDSIAVNANIEIGMIWDEVTK